MVRAERQATVAWDNTSGFGGASNSGMAGVPPALPPMCRKCRRVIDGTFRYCPHCGQRQDVGSAWYYHPVWILLLAFCVLGPFALPLVWRSRQMGGAAKMVTTVAILVYTAALVYLTWQITEMTLKPFMELNDVMRELHPR